jgi:quinol monooxygenase YgiN
MYAAILQLTFPAERHDEVARFLRDEMMAVIRDNEGFVDFRVLDAGTPGELVIIDTWHRQEDAMAAIQRPSAQGVHARYAELGIAVASATRYSVLAFSH